MAKALNQIETRHTRRVRFEFKEVDRELVDRCEKRLQDEVERLTGFKFAVTEGQVMGKKGVVIFVRRMDLSESTAKLIPKSSAEMPAKPPAKPVPFMTSSMPQMLPAKPPSTPVQYL